MKLNISNPVTGQQKPIVIDDDKKLLAFFGKRMGQEVTGDGLGEEWKDYVFKITGGNDKDGFSMKQGVFLAGRTRLLMKEGHSCYRPRRTGERKKKSIRGCIVGADLSVLALAIVKPGPANIEGLTDNKLPRRRGPKRATAIRKLFKLQKKDDPRRFVVLYSRKIEKNGKVHYKTPKIQRLVTDVRLRRKELYKAEKKERWQASKKARDEYVKLLTSLRKKRMAGLRKVAPKETKVDTKVDPKKAAPATKDIKKTGKDAPKVDPKAVKKDAPKVDPKKDAPKTEPKKDAPKTEPKKDAPKPADTTKTTKK